MILSHLKSTLNEAAKASEIYATPDGSRLLVLPYGARVLGLFTAASENNFFWTHTALNSAASAKAFYESDQWHNSGGDRTWVAPEIDIFFPQFPNTEVYHQPPQLDPGNYQIERIEDSFRLFNSFALALTRPRKTVHLRITKSWSPAPNPLRHDPDTSDASDIEYAGYTQQTALELLETDAGALPLVGLWNLLQLPHGGEMFIPCVGPAEPKVFFGQVGQSDLMVSEHLIRYSMSAAGIHKIGMRAASLTGRVGYLYSDGTIWSLVIRNFFVNPSGEYIDVPWDTPQDASDPGYAVQACNVNSDLGKFSELEYHAPAIGGDSGDTRSVDTSQVWAYRGSEGAIRAIARVLLSPSV